MDTVLLIVTAVIIFLQILQIIVLVEILLAWTPILFGRAIRIEAISSIVEPLAEWVSRVIPSRFGVLDFSRAYLIILFELIIMLLLALEPAAMTSLPF